MDTRPGVRSDTVVSVSPEQFFGGKALESVKRFNARLQSDLQELDARYNMERRNILEAYARSMNSIVFDDSAADATQEMHGVLPSGHVN